jgi:hypothetical protein
MNLQQKAIDIFFIFGDRVIYDLLIIVERDKGKIN